MEVVKPKFAFQAIVGEGKGSILYGGEEMPNGYYGEHKAGEQIALKAVADSGYEFVGWYTDANEPQLISANAEHTFTTGNAPQTVKAVFNAVVTSLKLDAATQRMRDLRAAQPPMSSATNFRPTPKTWPSTALQSREKLL